MSWGAVAVGAGTAVLGYMGQQDAASSQAAANRAGLSADKATRAAEIKKWEQEQGIGAEQAQSMRDYSSEQLGTWGDAGAQASQQQQAMLGLQGAEAQQAAYGAIQESPGQKFIRDRQQKALLRGSAAIGGLGGGTVRTALQEQAAGFASQDIDKQLGRLQALSGQGMQARGQMVGKDVGISETGAGLMGARAEKEAAAAAEAKRRRESKEAQAYAREQRKEIQDRYSAVNPNL